MEQGSLYTKTGLDIYRIEEISTVTMVVLKNLDTGERIPLSSGKLGSLGSYGFVAVPVPKLEIRSEKLEVRSKKLEVRSKKREVRSEKSEVRSEKLEVRSKKLEVRSNDKKSDERRVTSDETRDPDKRHRGETRDQRRGPRDETSDKRRGPRDESRATSDEPVTELSASKKATIERVAHEKNIYYDPHFTKPFRFSIRRKDVKFVINFAKLNEAIEARTAWYLERGELPPDYKAWLCNGCGYTPADARGEADRIRPAKCDKCGSGAFEPGERMKLEVRS